MGKYGRKDFDDLGCTCAHCQDGGVLRICPDHGTMTKVRHPFVCPVCIEEEQEKPTKKIKKP